MKKISVGVVLLLSSVFTSAGWSAETKRAEREITVQGTGQVRAIPDIARLTVEVVEDGPRVEDVTQRVRSKIEAVLKAVRAKGIAEKDLQTESYRVTPLWRWEGGKQSRTGYQAADEIRITVRDLKQTGGILSAVVDAGANSVRGPDFDFDSRKDLERKALSLAMTDAAEKATLLAKAAGAVVGDVVLINESGVHLPQPRM